VITLPLWAFVVLAVLAIIGLLIVVALVGSMIDSLIERWWRR